MLKRMTGVAVAAMAVCGWASGATASEFQFQTVGVIASGTNTSHILEPLIGDLSGLTIYVNGDLYFPGSDPEHLANPYKGFFSLLISGKTGSLAQAYSEQVSGGASVDFSRLSYSVAFSIAGAEGQVAFSTNLTFPFTETVGNALYTGISRGSGNPFSINLTDQYGTLDLTVDQPYSANDGILFSPYVNAVPLPSTAPLLGAALLALGGAGYAQRRRSRSVQAA